MRIRLPLRIAVVLGAVIPLVLAGAGSAAAAVCGAWIQEPSVSPSFRQNELVSVTSISPTDAWAVGDASINNQVPLAEHWNGATWSSFSVPIDESASAYLAGVASISTTNVWAVGYLYNQGPPPVYRQLIEHWDGLNWSEIAPPRSRAAMLQLFGLTAVPGTDELWAVGYAQRSTESGPIKALIEHYDGTSWTRVRSANPTSYNVLYGVSATSSTDVWAVGKSAVGTKVGTLVEHWDGVSWSTVPSPSLRWLGAQLHAVSAIKPNKVWAVGYRGTRSLIEHWNGRQWIAMKSANPGADSNQLFGVFGLDGKDVWAVGSSNTSGTASNLIEHWDGTSWSVFPSPQPGPPNRLFAVGGSSASDVWALGSDLMDNYVQTQALRYC
jgi:hypothetical protein